MSTLLEGQPHHDHISSCTPPSAGFIFLFENKIKNRVEHMLGKNTNSTFDVREPERISNNIIRGKGICL